MRCPRNGANLFSNSSSQFAHNFYVGQWLRDVTLEFQQLQKQEQDADDVDAASRRLRDCQRKKDALLDMASSAALATAPLKGETPARSGQRVPANEEQARWELCD